MSILFIMDSEGRTAEASATITVTSFAKKHRRASIRHLTPHGYRPIKDGKIYVLHRTHLIGDQFLTDGANDPRNIITGFFELNIVRMLPIENALKKYVLDTGHAINYRVRPLYFANCKIPHALRLIATDICNQNQILDKELKNEQKTYVIDYVTGILKKIC